MSFNTDGEWIGWSMEELRPYSQEEATHLIQGWSNLRLPPAGYQYSLFNDEWLNLPPRRGADGVNNGSSDRNKK